MRLANIKSAISHRLFMKSAGDWVRRNLKLSFLPYYLTEEGLEPIEFNDNDPVGFEVCLINTKDLEEAAKLNHSLNLEHWRALLDKGHICVALKKSNILVAYCWAVPEEYSFRPGSSPLGPRDAYLYNAFTLEEFRGMGLAPYMRKHCYEILRAQGYRRLFSITEYFNTSAINFKMKLGARFISCNLKFSFRNREFGHLVLSRNNAQLATTL